MNTDIIEQSWKDLAGRRVEFVEAFYATLFDRYPHYRELFPEHMNEQLEKMVEMVSTLARLSEQIHLLQPYLQHVGYQHRHTGIRAEDVDNFKDTFLDTLAEYHHGDESLRGAWEEAFDTVVVPLFDEGLERGRDQL